MSTLADTVLRDLDKVEDDKSSLLPWRVEIANLCQFLTIFGSQVFLEIFWMHNIDSFQVMMEVFQCYRCNGTDTSVQAVVKRPLARKRQKARNMTIDKLIEEFHPALNLLWPEIDLYDQTENAGPIQLISFLRSRGIAELKGLSIFSKKYLCNVCDTDDNDAPCSGSSNSHRLLSDSAPFAGTLPRMVLKLLQIFKSMRSATM